MKSNYHIELNETQEHAENRAEQLKETDVLIFGPDDFKEHFLSYLKFGENTPISKDMNFQDTFLEEEGPKVLAEQYASFCTLMLAFNEEGEGMVLHLPMVDMLGFQGEVPEGLEDTITDMKNFVEKTNGLLIITGTNVQQLERDQLMKALKLETDDKTLPIFTTTNIAGRDDIFGNNLENSIQGICFIPKQLSTDNRNKVILLGQKITRDEFEEAVRPSDLLNKS